MTVKEQESVQCSWQIEVERWGRHVADFQQCGNRTRHPSGRCWRHRSTYLEDATAPVGATTRPR